jgi:hypothetical protein
MTRFEFDMACFKLECDLRFFGETMETKCQYDYLMDVAYFGVFDPEPPAGTCGSEDCKKAVRAAKK